MSISLHKCPVCDGECVKNNKPCPACKGKGYIQIEKKEPKKSSNPGGMIKYGKTKK